MIRINLLPFRAERKKENIRRQISIYLLSLLFVCLLSAYFMISLNRTLRSLEERRAEKQKELASYAETNRRIAAIKKKIADLHAKLDVIKKIENNKAGPVNLLDEIATAVPTGKLWLRSLSEKKGRVILEGTAMDNDTVALYMTNLEKAQDIMSVDLKSTKLKTLREYKQNVCDFILNLKIGCIKAVKTGTENKREKK
jgi:type IV pilus assembly protein PilN